MGPYFQGERRARRARSLRMTAAVGRQALVNGCDEVRFAPAARGRKQRRPDTANTGYLTVQATRCRP
jgi:hypothetical protein